MSRGRKKPPLSEEEIQAETDRLVQVVQPVTDRFSREQLEKMVRDKLGNV